MTKPFAVNELLARIRAHLRRASRRASDPETYSFGDVELNFRTHDAKKAGRPVELSAREFEILKYFVARRGEAITRDQLLDGVICLISALSFHGITTEVPHEVYLAIRHGKERPRLDYPPLRAFRFSDGTLFAGVEKHKLEGVTLRLFNPAKTVADCFKFRHKIGVDVAVEALKLSLARGKARPAQILHYARLCRVERVIRPYLEALV